MVRQAIGPRLETRCGELNAHTAIYLATVLPQLFTVACGDCTDPDCVRIYVAYEPSYSEGLREWKIAKNARRSIRKANRSIQAQS